MFWKLIINYNLSTSYNFKNNRPKLKLNHVQSYPNNLSKLIF